MADVTSLANTSILVPNSSVVQSNSNDTTTLQTGVTVLVNVIQPLPESLPYFDKDLQYTSITFPQLITALVAKPEAIDAIGAVAKAAVAYTIYKYKDINGVANLVLNVSDGAILDITLNDPLTTISFSSFTDEVGFGRQITLMLRQGTGSNLVNWPAQTKWSEGRKPPLSFMPNRVDFVSLMTKDSGVKWWGFHNGSWIDA